MIATKPRVRVRAGTTLLPAMPDVARMTALPRYKSAYMQGGRNPFLMDWMPMLRNADTDTKAAYMFAASRAIETIQNSGWIAGAIDQAVANTVGQGLRLAAMPDATALKWTQDQAQQWSRDVERRWDSWAGRPQECDILGQSSIGKMTGASMRSFFAYGEITAAMPYIKRDFAQYGSKVQMIEPHRLIQQSNNIDMFQGIQCDAVGYPLSYRIREEFGLKAGTFRDIPPRDPYGRPQFIHVFDGPTGARRGIPPITPALKVVRQFDQLSDATLTAALIQAIFAATVKSPDPTEVALQAFQDFAEQAISKPGTAQPSALEAMMQGRAGWYDGAQISLGSHGKIAHLAPGDELTFHASQHPNDTYEAFVKYLLREIARCLGITFETLTGDYSGATYSSVRMATSEIWALVIYRRANILTPYLNPIYEAWLEEDIERGWTPFPGGIDGFLANRAAATRCHWRGPAKPQADDAKFAQAVSALMGLGVITAEWVCAEMGEDWMATMDQLAREMAYRKMRGLPDPVFKPGVTADAANAPAEIAAQPTPAPAGGR